MQGCTVAHDGKRMVVFTKPELRSLDAPITASGKPQRGGTRPGGETAHAGDAEDDLLPADEGEHLEGPSVMPAALASARVGVASQGVLPAKRRAKVPSRGSGGVRRGDRRKADAKQRTMDDYFGALE